MAMTQRALLACRRGARVSVRPMMAPGLAREGHSQPVGTNGGPERSLADPNRIGQLPADSAVPLEQQVGARLGNADQTLSG